MNVNFGDILFHIFSNNTANVHGGAMKTNNFYLVAFNGITTFANNSAHAGGAININDRENLFVYLLTFYFSYIMISHHINILQLLIIEVC